ncbi:hypothetical protein QBC37DRAFT_389847 [Rhypophila decipiens]|uniref:Uncharacterized protein n=1 Tax=Rhypophila decipiens TaxID=261697 RepID=A0AAN7B7R8_9PEZI|nr:hypothetical protein QBC37DRAFT_389847 [Rhypophila decipiens]
MSPVGAHRFKGRVEKIARELPRFKPLQSFLSLQNTTTSRIKVIDFPGNERRVQSCDIEEHGLCAAIAEPGIFRRLVVVENLSPQVATISGYNLDIQPKFFLEYLDAIPPRVRYIRKDQNQNVQNGGRKTRHRLEAMVHV